MYFCSSNKRVKKYRKILIYAGVVLAVLVVAISLSVFLFKDKIIREFIREANKNINTPIRVKKIDVSFFQNFPRFSIVLYDVYVEDSHDGEYPLLTASKIAFQMNPFEVYRGVYNIQGLQLEDCEASFKIDEKGKNNYTVIKETETGKGGGSVSLELKNVLLENTHFTYVDLKAKQDLDFNSRKLKASIRTSGDLYTIEANGDVTSQNIQIEGNSFLTGKAFEIKSKLLYDDSNRKLTINPSQLRLKSASFGVSGIYTWKSKNLIQLDVQGEDTDIQTLLSLFPETSTERFGRYDSKGDVYFKAHLEGEISKNRNPAIKVDFGFNNATIFHPDYKARIEGAVMEGSFSTPDLFNAEKATLTLRNIKGLLNNESFKADFAISDFTNPEVNCSFNGKLDASAVFSFYPVENINEVTGNLMADVSFNGKIELLKNKATAQRVSTQGNIELQNINLKYGSGKIPLQNLKGSLQFSNNDLALSNVSGKYGNSDFLLNGFFKNIITFLLFENQPVGIEADLKSAYLDVNQLFEIGYGSGPQTDDSNGYKFNISKNVYLNFNCDVRALRYKRFHGEQLKGDLLVKNKVAVSRKLSVKTMGGNLTLSGIVDASNPKAIDVMCSSHLSGIHVDSAFYVFENFDQDFIQDKHLKGQATADVSLEMTLSQELKLFPETLIADISASIKNGELNNFEPMRKLNKYLDDEGLSKLRFSDLKNDIHIEKKTIYIPQMEVRSNVTDIRISGTHTFDQRIDYRVVAPLRGKRKVTEQEASTAMENDGKGQTRLFLKITGTTDDYKISLDTEAVRKKIASDLKKEVKELKDAFKNKETQKKKEIELQEDEYFEWSE